MTGSRAAGLLELIRDLGADPHRPRLVCYAADGARTELSGASLGNWTAKVAGLLTDELGLGPDDLATVTASTGWQLAPVLLGCWWAGLGVTAVDDPGAAVAFVDSGADGEADEVFVLSGHPLGAPATDIADHQRDFTTSVLPQSDQLGAAARSGADWTAAWEAGQPVTAAALALQAATVGERFGGAQPVLISTLPWTVPHGLAGTLLAALMAGGCLVHCPPDVSSDRLASIAASERATASAGVEVPGLQRIDG